MKRLEALIDWGNDLSWGPLEWARPPKDINIGGRRFGLLCAICVTAMLACIAFAVAVIVCLGGLAIYWLIPRQASVFAATRECARWVTGVWWLLPAAGAAFPLLWSPCVLRWNRRAGDLRRRPAPPQQGRQDQDTRGEVWPPPPRRA